MSHGMDKNVTSYRVSSHIIYSYNAVLYCVWQAMCITLLRRLSGTALISGISFQLEFITSTLPSCSACDLVVGSRQ